MAILGPPFNLKDIQKQLVHFFGQDSNGWEQLFCIYQFVKKDKDLFALKQSGCF